MHPPLFLDAFPIKASIYSLVSNVLGGIQAVNDQGVLVQLQKHWPSASCNSAEVEYMNIIEQPKLSDASLMVTCLMPSLMP